MTLVRAIGLIYWKAIPSLLLVFGFGPRGRPNVLERCAWLLPLVRVRVIGRFCWNGITPVALRYV